MAKHPPISSKDKYTIEHHFVDFLRMANIDQLGGEMCCVQTEYSVLKAIVLGEQDPVEWILKMIEDYVKTEIPDKKTEKVYQ